MSDDRAVPNPYTGLNGRGFPEGVYIHVAVKQRVLEDVTAALPAPWALDFLDFWYDAESGDNAQVKLVVHDSIDPTNVQTRYITVPNEGFAPWAGMVGPTLVEYVKVEFA